MSFLSTIEKATSTRYLRYSFADPLQSASVITDATGQTIQETIDYMPYGAVRVDSKSNGYGGTKKGYIQSERDSSGLNYMQNRFQNPVQGRFISLDPVSANVGSMSKMPAYLLMMNQSGGTIDQTQLLSDPQLLNFYSYARSNPVTMSDPSGLASTDAYFAQAQVLAQVRTNFLIGAQSRFNAGVATMGKVGMVGAAALSVYVAPEIAGGAIVGVVERKTQDMQQGRTSTNGQLVGAGMMGAITGGATAKTGFLGTILLSGVIATGGSIAIDGSAQPVDITSSVFAATIGKYTGNAFSTPQTKSVVGNIAEYVTNTVVNAVMTAPNSKNNKQK